MVRFDRARSLRLRRSNAARSSPGARITDAPPAGASPLPSPPPPLPLLVSPAPAPSPAAAASASAPALAVAARTARSVLAAWQEDYNTVRPHSALGNLPPAIYAKLSVPAMQRDGTLRSLGGSAPRPVAPPSHTGSNEERTLIQTG